MQDFPANSRKAQERSEGPGDDPSLKKVEQVTSATAERRKRRLGGRFKETFVGGSARGAIDYMVLEVIIPEIQDMVINAFQGGVERLIRGEGPRGRRTPSSTYSNQTHVNYAGMSTNKPTQSRSISQKSRARHDFGEIVIQDRQEAVDVLDRLYEELSRYGEVNVAVLYELTGIQSSHTDHRWGWTSLRGARVATLRGGGGYLLNLPEPQPLDR